MRSSIFFYLNGKKHEISGDDAFLPLANYLRKNVALPGTKIVCAEGDCGACTVLVHYPLQYSAINLAVQKFKIVNSCIIPLYLLDGASVVSIEGLSDSDGKLSQVQRAMIDCHGSQCGYCTPGFVAALSGLLEEKKFQKKSVDLKGVKNYCTGNLCRCTGYEPIIQAGSLLDPQKWVSLEKRYLTAEIAFTLKKISKDPFMVKTTNKICYGPTNSKDISKILKSNKNIRIVSAATDLGVLHNKEKIDLYQVMTLHNVAELFESKESSKEFRVGARVDLETLRIQTKKIFPTFSEFLNIFASLQIRNFATLVGNVANASPIGDTIPFLFVAEAQVEVMGSKKKLIPITQFYKGYKKMDLGTGEWISAIIIPKLSAKSKVKIYKISQRRDLDISTVSAAFYREEHNFRISYGGVAATTIRMKNLEKFMSQLKGKPLTDDTVLQARQILKKEITPLSDARASKEFRLLVSENLLRKFAAEEL